MELVGNFDKELNLKDNKLPYLILDSSLLIGKIDLGEKQICFDFSRLLELQNININQIPIVFVDDYLNYMSSLRFTLDGFISQIEMSLNKLLTEKEIWMAERKDEAKKAIFEECIQLVEQGKVTKSFISEPSKDKIQDRVIIENKEIYKKYINSISDYEEKKKFFSSLLDSIQQASICLMNIINRRKI